VAQGDAQPAAAERDVSVVRRLAQARAAARLPAAQAPHAELVQREVPRAEQERGARLVLLLLRHRHRHRPYAVARRPSSPSPRKR
jgi:hypothetical protein